MDPNALLLALLTGGGLVKMLDIASNRQPRIRKLNRENQHLQDAIDDWHDWRHKVRHWMRVREIDTDGIPDPPEDEG